MPDKKDRDERFTDWAVGDKNEPGTIEIIDDVDEEEYDKEDEDGE